MRKIDEGTYTVDVECPRCHTFALVLAELSGRLIVDAGQPGELRVVCSSKAVKHRCGVPVVDVALPGFDEDHTAELSTGLSTGDN